MSKVTVRFRPVGADGLECRIETPAGREVALTGTITDVEPSVNGDHVLAANPALVTNLWAYGLNEKLARK